MSEGKEIKRERERKNESDTEREKDRKIENEREREKQTNMTTKTIVGIEQMFFLQLCIVCCMRGAVYISYIPTIFAGPRGP